MEINIKQPFDLIHLPSQGKYYEHKTSALLVKFLTSHEERILSNPYLIENGFALKTVLSSCIIDKEINPEELIVGDIQAISMFLRSTAYGDKINFEIECPECGRKIEPEMYISKMQSKDMKYFPQSDGLLHCQLDGHEFKIKIPTFKDEIEFSKFGAESRMKRLEFLIQEMDGKKEKKEISFRLQNMNILMGRKLNEFIEENTPGVDPVLNLTCGICSAEFKTEFKVGFNFISLPIDYYQNILEECFLLQYYGKGITLEHAKDIPVNERRWYINRISEEIDKKRKAEEKAYNAAKSKSKR